LATATLLNDASPVAEANRRTSDQVASSNAVFPLEWELPTTHQRGPATAGWSYEEAFSRNLGLISREEQTRLRTTRVAVAGLGGVGGVDLVTLARLGIGKFTIADPDVFEVANFNRQYGATTATLGLPKAAVMADAVRTINPDAQIRVIREPIDATNVDEFLHGADVLVDGIDAFEIDVRRLLFRAAAKQGIFGIGAGPVGFSTAWVLFDPRGMTYDRYFDFSDDMSDHEKFSAYIVGMAPKCVQRSYMQLEHLNYERRRGPSASLACQLASGVLAAEVLKMLLGRGPLYAAPYFHQFDAYLGRYTRRRLWFGNRNPLQKVKRRWLTSVLKRRGSPNAAIDN
jgi:molybdopterin/thiamine biosynthesis adenylyltransferase